MHSTDHHDVSWHHSSLCNRAIRSLGIILLAIITIAFFASCRPADSRSQSTTSADHQQVQRWESPSPPPPPPPPIANSVQPGGLINSFDFAYVDDLLRLDQLGARMVIFRIKSEAEISSAHLAKFQQWIKSGGIGYFMAGALEGSLSRKLKLVQPEYVTVEKENNVQFVINRSYLGMAIDSFVGELFVRDAVPFVTIHDHPIMNTVSSLYIAPPDLRNTGVDNDLRSSGLFIFHSTDSQIKSEPVLSVGYYFTNATISGYGYRQRAVILGARGGERATVMAAVRDSAGIIVFDGTGLLTGNNHFNGKKYDLDAFLRNVGNYQAESK